MLALNLPSFEPKLKKTDRLYIWDRIRRKYVVLTPEEWVRQHFVNFLIVEKKYPETLLANEVSIVLNGQNKRADSVVYDQFLQPLAIIEYKAPHIKISQNVFDQIARYNIIFKVKFLIVSNGFEHYCCFIDYEKMSFTMLSEIPNFHSLQGIISG